MKRTLVVSDLLQLSGVVLLMAGCSPLEARRGIEKTSDTSRQICLDLGGRPEQTQKDGTRADCITPEYAYEIEMDAEEVYEAIGQSLHYAMASNRKPAIVLVVDSKEDEKYWKRLKAIVSHHELTILLIKHQISRKQRSNTFSTYPSLEEAQVVAIEVLSDSYYPQAQTHP